MPEIFRKDGYVFFFYMNEGNEPIHIHVRKGDGFGKFWIDPIALDFSQSMKTRELTRAEELVQDNADLIRRKWDEVFGT